MLLQDLRFGLRTLLRSPAFATVSVLSLALGIGANTAIFSLIDAVMLRKLPVKNPDGLYIAGDPAAVNSTSYGSQHTENFSYPTYRNLRERSQLFSGIFASADAGRLDLSINGKPDATRTRGRLVSGSYFPLLGVSAQIGRVLLPDDDKIPGAHPVAVISDGFWQRKFAANPNITGQTIGLNGRIYTIVGVTPPEFRGEVVGQYQDVWIPIAMQAQIMPGREWLNDFRYSWIQIMVRLKPGVTEQQARAATDVLVHQILLDQEPDLRADQARSYRESKVEFHRGATGFSSLRANFSEPLLILMSVVGLVLLIACANVANLLLARATARQKEIGIRLALGAGRSRLIRQLLTESVLLAALGATAGLLIAHWGSRLLLRLVDSDGIPLHLRLDLRILGFTSGVAILTGLLFGLAPALRATRVDLNSGLKESGRGLSSSGSRLSLGKLLVVAQVALSLLLLIGAGLFVRSLQNLQHVDLGYERDHLLLMNVDATSAGYKGARAMQLWRQVRERVARVPGVKGVTFSQNGLFSGSEGGTGIEVEGFTPHTGHDRGCRFDEAGPDYFETVGIPILKGRGIGEKDNENAPKIAVVNLAMARFYFMNRDPIGRHFTYEDSHHNRSTREIVGVVKDVRDHNLKGEIARRFYLPSYQPYANPPGWVNLEIRTRAEPKALAATVRAAIQEVDRTVPISNIQALTVNVDNTITQERLIAQLSAFFGLLALLLACIGLYGIMSYAMARRTNEIGIRMALGAQPATVLWMALRESLLLVALGIAIGLPCALALTRLVASRLFGLQPWDPATMGAATTILIAVAVIAGYVPARKASRLNPVNALRYE